MGFSYYLINEIRNKNKNENKHKPIYYHSHVTLSFFICIYLPICLVSEFLHIHIMILCAISESVCIYIYKFVCFTNDDEWIRANEFHWCVHLFMYELVDGHATHAYIRIMGIQSRVRMTKDRIATNLIPIFIDFLGRFFF